MSGGLGSRTTAPHAGRNDARYRDARDPGQSWLTPAHVLALVDTDLGGIAFDPCSGDDAPDGLAAPWPVPESGGIFVNPPYGAAKRPWLIRCVDAAEKDVKVIALVPAATDTKDFQRAAVTATAVVFVARRLTFTHRRPNGRRAAASHPSALLGWNTTLAACSVLGLRFVR